jgi:ribosomal protein S18 acetylase RimI-like enzyme
MAEYTVRTLAPGDFDDLMRLEEVLFGQNGEKTLGPYYLRLCCDFFRDTCFVVRADGEAVGYLLAFVRGREAHCSTLAIVPAYQRTRAVHHLARALFSTLAGKVDVLWFTVHEKNAEARALHATLGAREVSRDDEYFGPGEPRIISRIERGAFERVCARMARLGLLDPPASFAPPETAEVRA